MQGSEFATQPPDLKLELEERSICQHAMGELQRFIRLVEAPRQKIA
jgi:hypothetical protein